MKTILSILFVVIAFSASAQNYSCETSRIGKMVIKPLIKNGIVHYQLAVKDTSDVRGKTEKDFTSILDNTSKDGNIYVARHISKGETDYDLLFVQEKSGKCIYQVTRIGKGGLYGIRLNADGEVVDWDENTRNTPSMQKDQEKLAEEWLRYFQ